MYPNYQSLQAILQALKTSLNEDGYGLGLGKRRIYMGLSINGNDERVAGEIRRYANACGGNTSLKANA